MESLPARPHALAPALPPGWTEHKAPSGHTYYYNKELKKSTYTRPPISTPESTNQFTSNAPPAPNNDPNIPYVAQSAPTFTNPQLRLQDMIFASAPKQFIRPDRPYAQFQGTHRGGHRGGTHHVSDRRRQIDRPKHRRDIPNCAPWVLVWTKLGRRFVWNTETNESFWKFPPDVMKAVIELDRLEREKKERRARGELSDVENEDAMAQIEAELATAEEEVEIVEVDGEEGMEDEEEYEEVEVTDDEADASSTAAKRQRIEESTTNNTENEPVEDDLAWQLAQMEQMEIMQANDAYDEGGEYYEDDAPPLTDEDCQTLFRELLDDLNINPYTPWDTLLASGTLYDDARYKALPTMKSRKDCFDAWARTKAGQLRDEKAKQAKRDPRIPYLALLDAHATPKLYWPEFRRKYKKEPEIRDTKLPDKEKERLYREHIKRLGMRSAELKADLSRLLKEQPAVVLNRDTRVEGLPGAVLGDLRFISLPSGTRDELIRTYISTLPLAPEPSSISAEDAAAHAKKLEERERRNRALAERERRVREEKKRQERDVAVGRGRLKEEGEELECAMRVGREGLRGQLEG